MRNLLRKRPFVTLLAAATAGLVSGAASTTALAGNGNAGPTLSFFSGGNGAHADWLATSDQPPGDTDNQAIRLLTTNGAPTFAKGYAGILVHHVTGIPAADFPDSSFWNKTPNTYFGEPSTLGSPRLVVEFQDAAGEFDGYAALRENVRGNGWEEVSDQTNYPNAAWDVMGGAPPCAFLYDVSGFPDRRRVRHLPPDRRHQRRRENVLQRFRQQQREQRPRGAHGDNGSEPPPAHPIPGPLTGSGGRAPLVEVTRERPYLAS